MTSHSVLVDESITEIGEANYKKEDLSQEVDLYPEEDLRDIAYPNPKASLESRPQEESHAEADEGRPKREV